MTKEVKVNLQGIITGRFPSSNLAKGQLSNKPSRSKNKYEYAEYLKELGEKIRAKKEDK